MAWAIAVSLSGQACGWRIETPCRAGRTICSTADLMIAGTALCQRLVEHAVNARSNVMQAIGSPETTIDE